MKEEIVRASLDRFEGEYAVIYSDADTRKFDVPIGILGKDMKPGVRLLLHLDGGQITKVETDIRETENAKDRIKRKYARLARKRPQPS